MRNLKILAWLYLVMGAFAGVVTLFFAAGVTSSDPDAALGSAMIAAVAGPVAAAALVLAWGLFTLRPWSRPLGLIVSVLHLPLFPVGTAVGTFGLLALNEPGVRALLAGGRTPRPTWNG
jgi:hypothetical protein